MRGSILGTALLAPLATGKLPRVTKSTTALRLSVEMLVEMTCRNINILVFFVTNGVPR
jgi:hypothetical protein